MDKWIRDLIDKYKDIVFENLYYMPYLPIKRLSKGFRCLVSDYLFYYDNITSNVLGDSDFHFILVHRSTSFKIDVDFYYGVLYIYVLVYDSKSEFFDQNFIGKFLISDFLHGFVSGHELYVVQYQDVDNQSFDDDQFEIPF